MPLRRNFNSKRRQDARHIRGRAIFRAGGPAGPGILLVKRSMNQPATRQVFIIRFSVIFLLVSSRLLSPVGIAVKFERDSTRFEGESPESEIPPPRWVRACR